MVNRDKDDLSVKRALQAVVLADSFAHAFKPLTESTAKVLLPIAHAPTLEYTLEWLATQGVEETFVVACAHAEAVEEYLVRAGWTGKGEGGGCGGAEGGADGKSGGKDGERGGGGGDARGGGKGGMVTHAIASSNCVSAGEALRLVDHKHVVRNDFILVSGDVVTNIDLKDALAKHRERRKKEKLAIMTLCLRKVGAETRESRYGDSNLTVAMNAESGQIVHYEEHGSGHVNVPAMALDASLFGEMENVRVRTDLMDCHVDICAPEFLMLFTDNFDYQHIRRDFIVGTLNERELGNTLYGYEISPRHYAARVHNLRSYDAVSRDIINRWVHPYVPDSCVVPAHDAEPYTHAWGNNYVSPEAAIDAKATVNKGCVIGAGSSIGAGAVISNSVIGKNVVIGADCVVEGAYIFDSARIADGVTVSNAFIQDGVVIHTGSTVSQGCVLAHGVVIGAGFTVAANARICLKPQPEVEDDDYDSDDSDRSSSPVCNAEHERDVVRGEHDEGTVAAALSEAKSRPGVDTSAIWNPASVGAGGAGYMWEHREEAWMRNIAPSKPREEYDCTREITEEERQRGSAQTGASGAAVAEESDSDVDEDVKREAVFQREVAETFLRCVKQGYAQENAVVELQGLKMAENRTFADIARYVLMTIIGLTLPSHAKTSRENVKLYPETEPANTTELLKRLRVRLKEWAPLLSRFLRSEDDQVEALLTLEEFCLEDEVFRGMGGSACVPSFAKILHILYDMDVISEDSILAWAEEKADADEADKKFLKLAQPFIDWLEEASSEEESDSDE